jgi:2-C-methyl-D-erythritol 4-phosphate cytidylyltransferase
VSSFFGITKLKYIVTGGSTLPQSMRNMIEAVNRCNDQYVVVMMDGDRIIRDDVIDSALDNYEKFGTTIPYFNPYEAAFYMVDGENTDLGNNELDRKKIFLVAPPIIYPSEVVNTAMQYAMEHGLEDTYLHQLVIKLGYKVSFVKCSPYNIKVTEPGDFEVVKALLHQS